VDVFFANYTCDCKKVNFKKSSHIFQKLISEHLLFFAFLSIFTNWMFERMIYDKDNCKRKL